MRGLLQKQTQMHVVLHFFLKSLQKGSKIRLDHQTTTNDEAMCNRHLLVGILICRLNT